MTQIARFDGDSADASCPCGAMGRPLSWRWLKSARRGLRGGEASGTGVLPVDSRRGRSPWGRSGSPALLLSGWHSAWHPPPALRNVRRNAHGPSPRSASGRTGRAGAGGGIRRRKKRGGRTGGEGARKVAGRTRLPQDRGRVAPGGANAGYQSLVRLANPRHWPGESAGSFWGPIRSGMARGQETRHLSAAGQR